jgi:hypothetical protein
MMEVNMSKRAHPEIPLRGDRNECPSCGELFNSSSSFDKHRVGEFAVKEGPNRRRCLTPDEMIAKGMSKVDTHFWVTKKFNPTSLDKRKGNV